MLTRIAAVGINDDFMEAARNAAGQEDVEVVPLTPDGAIPPGTTALLAGTEDVGSALSAAMAAGESGRRVMMLLAEAIDCREGLEPGSSERVVEHATRFARVLGLPPGERSAFERAALLRDIGKLRISNDVLLKSGALNYDEWVLLQRHPEIAGELLTDVAILRDTADIVRHHHECFDGDGYPAGLEGDAIPRLSRALKIIDVYCAMTSARHYREGHSSHEDAIQHIVSERGKHFDPELVDRFVDGEVGRPRNEPADTAN